ncbi:Tankyrase-1 [Zalerion maritima]|uniref:Tankyrase-1 n=1 Tax=Zalerion maritima TaxID=339359 RepID=A0AAD5WPH4_9PEZI|nr:Tankyrase-1 [Zalerion maritima]
MPSSATDDSAVTPTSLNSATPPVRKADIIPSNTFRRFFNSGLFSDHLTLRFSGRSVPVHRAGDRDPRRRRRRRLGDAEAHVRLLRPAVRGGGDEDEDEDGKALGAGNAAFVRMRRAVAVHVAADKYDVPRAGGRHEGRVPGDGEGELGGGGGDVFTCGKMGELLDAVRTARDLVCEHLRAFGGEEPPAMLEEMLAAHPELAVDIATMAAADPEKLKMLGGKDRQACPPLHDAAETGDMDEVARLLDEDGVDIDAQDRNGETALHLAAKFGHAAAVRYLVLCGANTGLASKKFARGTPMMWAKMRGHRDVKEVLERADAPEFPYIEGLDDD